MSAKKALAGTRDSSSHLSYYLFTLPARSRFEMQAHPGARTGFRYGALARPRPIGRQCCQSGEGRARQSAAFVQPGLPREPDRFADGRKRNPPAPARAADELPGPAFRHIIQDLPDHDASAFERWFAMADFGIGHNVLAKLNPFAKTLRRVVRSIFHIESSLRPVSLFGKLVTHFQMANDKSSLTNPQFRLTPLVGLLPRCGPVSSLAPFRAKAARPIAMRFSIMREWLKLWQ